MTPRGMILHQALHGYDDGHRLLASSIQLPLSDAKTVLQFSDSAGSGIRGEADAYVTAYPLRSGMYAVARTWPAPEQPRPGCVWTHTILVDFADLAVLPNLRSLLPVFKRPDGSHDQYKEQLVLENFEEPPVINRSTDIANAINTLYQCPDDRIVAPRLDRDRSEDIAFGIWSQQWPRLRRTFRFCTNSISDRSTDGHAFDLQFSGNESSIRSRFPKARQVSIADRPFPLWLELTLDDLHTPNAAGLRTFLHGVGGDVGQGRRSFTPLVQLHADLQGKSTNFSLLVNAINLLTKELKDVEALEIRASVAETAARHVTALDDTGIDYLHQNLGLLENRSVDATKLGHDLALRSPELFQGLLSTGKYQTTVAIQGLKAVTIAQALDLAVNFPATLPSVLKARPEIYSSVEFWRLPAIAVAPALVQAGTHGRPRDIVSAVISAGRVDLVKAASEAFGTPAILAVVSEQYSPGTAASLSPWFAEGARDLNALSGVLSSGRPLDIAFLSAVAHLVPADAVPNHIGDDPWLTAVRSTRDIKDDNYLKAYLLTRALGQSTRNSAELSVLGFAQIHEATAKGWLGDDAWSMLSPRLPHALLGFDWDRCWRLRAALVDLFVDRRLSPRVLATAQFDNELFFSLVHWACRGKRGREFMRGVSDELRVTGQVAKAKEVSAIAEDKWPF